MSSAAKRSSAVGAAADQFDMDQSAEVELQKLQRQVGMLYVWTHLFYGQLDVMTKCHEECWVKAAIWIRYRSATLIRETRTSNPMTNGISSW